jgi:hypothetical protein
LVLAAAVAALGLGLSQPAAAGGWDDSYTRGRYYGHGGTVYVHHHVFAPPRYRHVYHFHKPGPRHVHVVHYPGYAYGYRGYFAPRAHYRWRWYGGWW